MLGVLFVLGLLVLGSHLWRGRMPYDIHPTDEDWLPRNVKSLPGTNILNEPDPEEYRVTPFLDERPRKILLITIDTLRADHLSSYGYSKETSPFLDSLAGEGLKFTRAYAPMSKTLPSHVSLMTGLYPLQHNVRTNHHRVPDRFHTLAEHLAEEGYTTAGFVSTNRHFTPGNLDQGFDFFDSPADTEQRFRPPWTEGDTIYNLTYRSASKTIHGAQKWLRSRPNGERQFVWLHLFDPHFPYAYRLKYHDPLRYEDAERREAWMDAIQEQRGFDLRQGPHPEDPEKDPYISTYRLYDGEIRYVDAQLKSFYEFLNENWNVDPLSVITSDHGEGMGNHDWWGHSKYVYNEQIRVPLIVHHPEMGRGDTIETVTELQDLYATIGREARLPHERIIDDSGPTSSFPLQSLVSGEKPDGFREAFASRTPFSRKLTDPWGWLTWRWRELTSDPLRGPLSLDRRWDRMIWPGNQYVYLNQSYSYLHNTALRDEFYDQQNDFYQQINMIDDSTRTWERYGATVREILKELRGGNKPEPEEIDADTKKELEGLGYVN